MKASLTFKVNFLVFSVLALGIGSIAYYLSDRLVSNIDDNLMTGLELQSRSIYSAVESLMLPGQAALAEGYFTRLRTLDMNQEVHIYRTDGTEAFVDNKTIMGVNNILKRPVFTERPSPGSPERLAIDDSFRASITPPGGDQILETQEGGRSQVRLFRPLVNLPRCTVCHGGDHTFRGVLELRRDISSSRQEQVTALGTSAVSFLGVLLLSALVLAYFLSRGVLFPLRKIGEVCDQVAAGDLSPRVEIATKDELGTLAQRVNAMVKGLEEKLKLSKYVSGSTLLSVQGQEENCRQVKTLFFSDVRGFTAFSESRDPEEVVAVLNRLLTLQSSEIHTQGGDVDKYVGDEVFGVFPGELDGFLAACRAALAIQKSLSNADMEFSGLEVGIGLHQGEVIQGRIGSDRRADYTAIGDSVNLAARLCGAAGPGTILISATTAQMLMKAAGHDPRIRGWKLSGPRELNLKGKSSPQKVWQLKDGVGE